MTAIRPECTADGKTVSCGLASQQSTAHLVNFRTLSDLHIDVLSSAFARTLNLTTDELSR